MAARAIDTHQIVGKTVAAVAEYGRPLLIGFTDGTYLKVTAEPDGESAVLETGYPVYDSDRVSKEDGIRLGIWTAEVYDSAQAAREARRVEAERAEFERLKAKFGG